MNEIQNMKINWCGGSSSSSEKKKRGFVELIDSMKKKKTNLFISGRRFNLRSHDFRQMQHPSGTGKSRQLPKRINPEHEKSVVWMITSLSGAGPGAQVCYAG